MIFNEKQKSPQGATPTQSFCGTVPVFCPECWTFYKSSPLALFVAMYSSIQPNAHVGKKTCSFEELSAMHMRRSVQPERRSLQKHIFGEFERIL